MSVAASAEEPLAPDRPEFDPVPLAFPVVAVGASAGGLEAFGDLIGSIHPDDQSAYILVQHLDPTHESLLPELLHRLQVVVVDEAHVARGVFGGHVGLVLRRQR